MSKKSLTVLFLFISSLAFTQLKHPKASPAATVTQEVGLTTIKLEYSRPAVRGRKIFGDLVPYGRIWRLGANKSTKITFDSDVQIMGDTLFCGTYALYAFPEKKKWQIVFHTNTTHWGDGRKKYNPDEDALRVTVKSQKTESFQENFLITFDSISHQSATLILHWANTKVRLPFSVDTHEIMEQQIEERLSHQTKPQTYYEAARYYVEENMKHEIALVYLNRAIEIGGDTYYFYRVKSLAEAELGDYKSAINSAQKSLKLAQDQDKDEFVGMNQKSINLWKGKLNIKN